VPLSLLQSSTVQYSTVQYDASPTTYCLSHSFLAVPHFNLRISFLSLPLSPFLSLSPSLSPSPLGDSRGVLCRGGIAHPLSEDHKPNQVSAVLTLLPILSIDSTIHSTLHSMHFILHSFPPSLLSQLLSLAPFSPYFLSSPRHSSLTGNCSAIRYTALYLILFSLLLFNRPSVPYSPSLSLLPSLTHLQTSHPAPLYRFIPSPPHPHTRTATHHSHIFFPLFVPLTLPTHTPHTRTGRLAVLSVLEGLSIMWEESTEI
jgi:Protein phosphatase 2C